MKIYLAGGCFWGVQGYFDRLKGVIKSQVGYANSSISNPSYEMICQGRSDGVECLELEFDENILSLDEIFARFFDIIDPCAYHRQGNDIGAQYRSGIYSTSQQILHLAEDFIKKQVAPRLNKPILTEVLMLKNFYAAEEYHQKYLEKNPNGYCHIDLNQALKPYPRQV